MQLGEADRIDIVFREDEKVRAAAAKWYQLQGLAPWERRLARVSGIFSVVLNYFGFIAIGGAIGALVGTAPSLATWPTVFIGAFVAWIAVHRWMTWSAGLAERIHDAHDTGRSGTIHCRFDADGFTIRDRQRDWRNDWRGAALVEARADGLFIAREGQLFYFPPACWPDPARMRDETATINGWWRAATEVAS